MIRRVLLTSAAVLSFALVAPLSVQAQSLYISGGAAFPSGDDLSDVNTGWMAAGGVVFDIGTSGVWAGIDGTYGRNSIEDPSTENVKPFSIMGVFGYSFETQGNVDPYVFGGAGIQGVSSSEAGVDSESGFGWQLGGGVVFGSGNVRPYVEGRYHSASIDVGSGVSGAELDVRIFGALFGVVIGVGD